MNKENSAIDAKTPLVLVKDFAYELLFKRRFFVFTNKQLEDQGFKQDLFQECKAMYLNGQCKYEEDIVTLMVYLLMTKLPKNADLQAKAKDYDLSLLVPKGTKVNAVKEQFKAAVKTTERVPRDEAMVNFIALLAQQPSPAKKHMTSFTMIYRTSQWNQTGNSCSFSARTASKSGTSAKEHS